MLMGVIFLLDIKLVRPGDPKGEDEDIDLQKLIFCEFKNEKSYRHM